MSIVVFTAPTTEPLSVSEVMQHCRIDQSNYEPAPGVVTAALPGTPVAGNVDNGQHRYAVTFTTADGETQAGTVSAAVTVADKTDGYPDRRCAGHVAQVVPDSDRRLDLPAAGDDRQQHGDDLHGQHRRFRPGRRGPIDEHHRRPADRPADRLGPGRCRERAAPLSGHADAGRLFRRLPDLPERAIQRNQPGVPPAAAAIGEQHHLCRYGRRHADSGRRSVSGRCQESARADRARLRGPGLPPGSRRTR